MARSKNNKLRKKNKDHAAKAVVHPPHLTLKERKASAVTKKQLHHQEKHARKQQQEKNNNAFVSSLFGPLSSSKAKANSSSSSPKNKKKRKDPPVPVAAAAASTTTASSSTRTKNKSKEPQQQPQKKKRNRISSVTIDGAPLHYKSNSNNSNNNNNNNNNKKRNYPQPKNAFQLPRIQNATNCHVPWWTRQQRLIFKRQLQQQKESSSSPKQQQQQQQHYLFGTNVPHHLLYQLDAELEQFAQYVTLTPQECDARQFVANQVESLCQSHLHKKHVTAEEEQKVRVQIFGSFATLPVCAFCSDVDMALWGIVDADPSSDNNNNNNNNKNNTQFRGKHYRFDNSSNKEDQDSDNNKKPPAAAVLQRQARIDKWRDALDEAFADVDVDVDTDGGIAAAAATSNNNTKISSATTNPKHEKEEWKTALDQLLEDSNQGPDCYHHHYEEVVSSTSVVDNDNDNVKNKAVVASTTEVVDLTGEPDSSPAAKSAPTTKETRAKKSSSTTVAHQQVADESLQQQHQDLFVIDRRGVSEKETIGENKQDSRKDPATKAITTTSTNDKNQNIPETKHASKLAGEINDDAKSDLGQQVEVDNATSSDSEDDIADPLASLHKRQQRQPPQQQQQQQAKPRATVDMEKAIISLSDDDDDEEEHSSDYNDEDDEDDDDSYLDNDSQRRGKRDNIDMQVSFVHSPAPPTSRQRSSFGPTGQTRVQVVRALTNLGNILRRRQYTSNIQVIRKARVPIVKMETVLGFEGDIAVAGHNGTDTSQYAMKQVSRFQSFAVVVLVLKILLKQHNLDTPFTGGLGSFKLYVLVAHHLEQHLALGGLDRPGEVFLSFLVRYGKVNKGMGLVGSQRGMHDRARTPLSQHTVLESEGDHSAEMSNVFLVDHCIELFQRCWGRLSKKFNFMNNNVSKSDQQNNFSSLLVDLVDVESLVEDRSECLEKAAMLSQFCKTTKQLERQKEIEQQQEQLKEQQNAQCLKRKNSDDSKKSTSSKKAKTGKTKAKANKHRRKSQA